MILIEYQQGDISLGTALALGRQMISNRAPGLVCRIIQRSNHTVVTTELMLEQSGTISEEITAEPVSSFAPVPLTNLGKVLVLDEAHIGFAINKLVENCSRYLYDHDKFEIKDGCFRRKERSK